MHKSIFEAKLVSNNCDLGVVSGYARSALVRMGVGSCREVESTEVSSISAKI